MEVEKEQLDRKCGEKKSSLKTERKMQKYFVDEQRRRLEKERICGKISTYEGVSAGGPNSAPSAPGGNNHSQKRLRWCGQQLSSCCFCLHFFPTQYVPHCMLWMFLTCHLSYWSISPLHQELQQEAINYDLWGSSFKGVKVLQEMPI